MDPRIGQWCEDSDGDWGFVVGVDPTDSCPTCIPCRGVCTTLLPDAEIRCAPDPIPKYALPAVEAFASLAEVARLKAIIQRCPECCGDGAVEYEDTLTEFPTTVPDGRWVYHLCAFGREHQFPGKFGRNTHGELMFFSDDGRAFGPYPLDGREHFERVKESV